MKKILHLTGMEYSTKYGSMEKWFYEICFLASEAGAHSTVAFTERIADSRFTELLRQIGTTVAVLKSDDEIIDYVQRNEIDIAHIYFSFSGWAPLYKKLYKTGVTLFLYICCDSWYTFCDDWKKTLKLYLATEFFRVRTRGVQKYFRKIYFVADFFNRNYREFFRWDESNTCTLYLGIDRMGVPVNRRQHLGPPVITCVAFHGPIKGVDILLDSLKILADRGCDFRCYEIGGGQIMLGGDDTRRLKEQCKHLGLDDRVSWVGLTDDVRGYLEKTDIVCQPSRSEGLSFSILESLDAGLPVVATAVGGIPEVVLDGMNGYLVSPDEPEALADALQKLIENPILRNEMGRKSSEYICEDKFSKHKNLCKIIEDYGLRRPE